MSVQLQLNRAFVASDEFARRFEENAARMEALAGFLETKFLAGDAPPGEKKTLPSGSPYYEPAKDIVLLHKEEFSEMYNELYEASPSNAPIELSLREWLKILEYSRLYLSSERVYAVYYRTQTESHLLKAHQEAWASAKCRQ